MGLIGSLIGTGVSALGGALAGSASNSGYRAARKLYNQRMADIKAHRDKVYYQDPSNSAATQAAVTQAQQILDDNAKRAKDAAIVSGGTEESVALQKQAGANAVGKILQQQAVAQEAQKEQAYQHAEDQMDAWTQYLANSKMQQSQQKASAISGAASGLAQAAGALLPW